MRLYTNMKPDLSNVVIFILIEQNGSYVMLCIFRKNLFGRPNICLHTYSGEQKKVYNTEDMKGHYSITHYNSAKWMYI